MDGTGFIVYDGFLFYNVVRFESLPALGVVVWVFGVCDAHEFLLFSGNSNAE